MARQDNPWDALPVVARSREAAPQQQANPWDSLPVVTPAPSAAPARQAAPAQVPSPSAPLSNPLDTIQSAIPGVRITSGFRDPERNQRVGGAPNSYHTRGQAFDLAPPPGMSMAQLEQQLRASGLPFRELLNEGDHVHIAWDGDAVGPVEALAGEAAPVAAAPEADFVSVGMAATEEPAAPLLGTRENPVDITNRDQVQQAKKGDWVRLANGDLTRAAGEAVQGEGGAEQAPGIFARESNLVDAIGAGATAAGEQIPFADEAAAGVVGLTSGLGYDAIRDRQAAIRATDNEQYRPARVAGGVTGFAAGLLAPGGAYIRGATGLGRTAGVATRGAQNLAMASRAAQVGGVTGAVYGAGAADDSFASRFSGAVQGGAIGAGTGGLFQLGAGRFAGIGSIAGAGQRPSRPRQLSREGVNLTPAQMLSDVPVIGGIAQMAEDVAAGYVPFVQGARNRATEDFQVATLNRALAEIGEELPRPSRVFGRGETGYEAVNQARTKFNEAYEGIIPRLRIVGDQQLSDDLAEVVARAEDELIDEGARGQIGRLLGAGVIGRMRNEGTEAVLDNQEFARVDRRLRTVVDNIRGNPNSNPDQITYADIVDDARSAVREALARQNPPVANDLRAINRGYAQYKLAERAASGSAAVGREGVATPGEFSQAVVQNATRGQAATNQGLNQDLARAGRGVLPAQLGNTGSGQRAVVGAAMVGGLTVQPQVAIPVIAATLAYSRPAQAVLNAIYRLPDSPQVQRQLGRLQSLARRNPALQPYYQEAVRYVTGQEPLRPQEPAAQSPAPEQRLAG